jgi:ABC-type microcin C transport system duplicated ATPase subunit YejF
MGASQFLAELFFSLAPGFSRVNRAIRHAHRTIVLHRGHIVEQGTQEELMRAGRDNFTGWHNCSRSFRSRRSGRNELQCADLL